MPRVAFSSDNKRSQSNFDYPKLKLTSGEYARILVLEEPIIEYAHTLRKPQIINGVPRTKTVENEKTGRKTTQYVTDFVSKPLCLGDPEVLDKQGSDPARCPICKLAKDDPDAAQAPQRRYAMHVIRYKTKGNGNRLVEPFTVETLVWGFTDKVFNKIVDLAEDWDLKKHDLILGPCTNADFQQFDISISPKAEFRSSAERKTRTIETFKNNQIEDLSIACGSKKERRWIDQDLETITELWNEVHAYENDGADTETGGSLDEDLNELLSSDDLDEDDEPVKPAAKRKPAAKKAPEPEPEDDDLDVDDDSDEDDSDDDEDDLDSLLASVSDEDDDEDTEDDEDDDEPEPAPAKRTAKKPAAKKDEDDEIGDIDDLLADVDV